MTDIGIYRFGLRCSHTRHALSLLVAGRPVYVLSLTAVFPARCYASAGTNYGPMSVRLPVRHKSVFYQNGWTDRIVFCWCGVFLLPVLQCVVSKFRYLQNKGTSLWNFILNSGLRKFRRVRHIDRRKMLSTLFDKGGHTKRDKLDRRQVN